MQIIKCARLCLLVASVFAVHAGFVQAIEQDGAYSNVTGLAQSVQRAVSTHPQINAALSALQAQKKQLTVLQAEFLPKISLGLGVGREDSNNTSSRAITGSGSDEMERRESSIFFRQMLFDGFHTHWMRESLLAEEGAQGLALRRLAGDVALKAVASHLNVMKFNRVLGDHIENLQAHERIAKDVGVRARSGKDDRAKVSQISARLSLSLANVETAKNNVGTANSEYLNIVGGAPGRTLTSTSGLIPMPEAMEEFVDEVMTANLQILSGMQKAKAASSANIASRNVDYPSLHIESGASWNDNVDGVSGRNSDAFIMLRMNYSLFNGGADRASKARAQYLQQASDYELDDIRRNVRLGAEQAWHHYKSNSRRFELLQDYVESAENTKSAYLKQFNIGQRSLIDLLDAENELLNARRLFLDAKNDLLLVKYQILNLKGVLLSVMSAELDEVAYYD
jgi:adhesin transport system outer membrane protein